MPSRISGTKTSCSPVQDKIRPQEIFAKAVYPIVVDDLGQKRPTLKEGLDGLVPCGIERLAFTGLGHDLFCLAFHGGRLVGGEQLTQMQKTEGVKVIDLVSRKHDILLLLEDPYRPEQMHHGIYSTMMAANQNRLVSVDKTHTLQDDPTPPNYC